MTRQKGSKPRGGDHLQKQPERRETRGDGPRWCPEPQGGEIDVSVPERGAAPER